jgi:micrococcal nuclease
MRSRSRARRRPLRALLILALSAIGAALAVSVPEGVPDAAAGETLVFGLCHRGGGTNCVVDGDSFWMHGERIRVADIDAPETHPPRCAEERRLGNAATARLHQLLNAGPVTLETGKRDTDRYGRKLRIVTRGGISLGDTLIHEGLARPWTGKRQPWC